MNQASDVDRADVAFHPPFLLLAVILIGFTLRWLLPMPYLPSGWAAIAGPICVALSLLFFFWAAFAMRSGGASIPTGLPTAYLVRSGPYRWSRNPIYVAMLALTVATGIWANSIWFICLAPVMVLLLNWGVISREERYLARKFGKAYLDYQQTVRRWC
jgi:protein-S-isoprenylcysteine O-methyltransferase Ste14